MNGIMTQSLILQFDQYFLFPENAKLFLLRAYHQTDVSIEKTKDFVSIPVKIQNKIIPLKKSTCLRAGTGLAMFQTDCHVFPGINIRELSRPFFTWFVSPLPLLAAVGKKSF